MKAETSQRTISAKPNLLVIGAMKSSTTLLHELLRRHDEIYFPDDKEPCYFSSDGYSSEDSWIRYLDLFKHTPEGARYVGEASVTYTQQPHCGPVPERIREALGTPKMVYVLRDPVERAVSHYRHSYLMGWYAQNTTFEQAIEQDPILVDTSRYYFQLEAFRSVFGASSVLLVLAEELHKRPRAALNSIAEFLDIRPFDGWTNELPRMNGYQQLRGTIAMHRALGKRSWIKAAGRLFPASSKLWIKSLFGSLPAPAAVTEGEKRTVRKMLADDVERLYGIVGPELDVWPTVRAG